jgi:hypothetical protein
VVECLNFQRQEQKLVLLKDQALGRYMPFDPMGTSEGRAIIGTNGQAMLLITEEAVTTKHKNFHTIELSQKGPTSEIRLNCQKINASAMGVG